MIDYSDVEGLIESCFNEMQSASRTSYDTDQADRTAALFLTAQMKLSFLIEDIEMKARNSKNEIERVEGEKYFEYKTANTNQKITENMITSYVAKESEVVRVKAECVQYEATLKKWNYVLNVLNNGHVFFRNIAKNKTWAE
jgi:hypothetical protein